MPSGDYGHELLFGTFVTPSAQRPDQVVELTRVAERAGLDLATFQDHPYHPGLLDAWTLLSYLAAATSRIRLAPNVLNLPLRQPVVVARSAAGLDLLTGGRVELGLGAGAFWDAIAAAGGTRLSPAQSVQALTEAIEIIRAVWAADERGGVRVHGTHHQAVGAKRGPAPAHDIGIWVGAYKPRMLRLVGRLADGWLPSLPYLQNGPSDLAAMNAHIDEGAAAAGRDPSAVRRLLNIAGTFTASGTGFLTGPPAQWAEELAALTLDDGITGFVLTSDDAATIERFAAEVASAARALVAAERAQPTPPDDDPDDDDGPAPPSRPSGGGPAPTDGPAGDGPTPAGTEAGGRADTTAGTRAGGSAATTDPSTQTGGSPDGPTATISSRPGGRAGTTTGTQVGDRAGTASDTQAGGTAATTTDTEAGGRACTTAGPTTGRTASARPGGSTPATSGGTQAGGRTGTTAGPTTGGTASAQTGGSTATATATRAVGGPATSAAPVAEAANPVAALATPAPAERHSARQVWDEGARPLAPTPAGGHTYSRQSMAVGKHLVDVHDHLRQELEQVRDLLAQVVEGSVTAAAARGVLNQLTMRQNNWTLGAYCAAYCTMVTQHHGLEDRSVFPHLRRADGGLASVLDRLEDEHVVIHELVEAVDRALVSLVQAPGDFTELQDAVDVLTDALLSHLSYEERQIVEPLARHGFFPGQV